MINEDVNEGFYKTLCYIKQKEINRLNAIILEQKETISDLQQYLTPPKFKTGDIVSVLGISDSLYVVDDFVCYDTSYPVYNIYAVANRNDFETVSEIDLAATGFF